jgi:hypothetical protein
VSKQRLEPTDSSIEAIESEVLFVDFVRLSISEESSPEFELEHLLPVAFVEGHLR